jgi:membrane protein implicated in regulation of membrane protease activity
MFITVPWWGWAILAAILAFGELHATGNYLIWIALGAALTAAAAAIWPLSVSLQLVVFALACLLSCFTGYFIYSRLSFSSSDVPLNRRNRLLIGTRGTVAVHLVNGRGKVRLGDSVWLAEGPDLREGTPIIVKGVRGSWVIVDVIGPLTEPSAPSARRNRGDPESLNRTSASISGTFAGVARCLPARPRARVVSANLLKSLARPRWGASTYAKPAKLLMNLACLPTL